MRIQKANSIQFQPVRAFYHAVIDGVGDSTDSVGWKKDIYPSPDFLKNSIGNGELYIVEEGETIVGTVRIERFSGLQKLKMQKLP